MFSRGPLAAAASSARLGAAVGVDVATGVVEAVAVLVSVSTGVAGVPGVVVFVTAVSMVGAP
jgi:hypothetical protein